MRPTESSDPNTNAPPNTSEITTTTSSATKPSSSSPSSSTTTTGALSDRKRKEYTPLEISCLNQLLLLWALVKMLTVLLSNIRFAAAAKTTTHATRLAFQQHRHSTRGIHNCQSRLARLGTCDRPFSYPNQQQQPVLVGARTAALQQFPCSQQSRFFSSSSFSRKNSRLSFSNRNRNDDYDDNDDDDDDNVHKCVPPQQDFDPIPVGTPVLVEVASFGPLGASVHVVAKSHDPQDLPPPPSEDKDIY